MFRSLFLSLSLALLNFPVFSQITPVNLQLEYQTTPLGIDSSTPSFSWQLESSQEKKGVFQSAYQIKVYEEQGGLVWDSGKTVSDLSLGIRYKGTQLKPRKRYSYEVRVWDEVGQDFSASSWFETGLMRTSLDAWNGAQWIGGSDEDLNFFSHYVSVFKVEYRLQLDKNSNSTKASFLLGGNDSRLMDSNKNIQGVLSNKNEIYIRFELDTAPLSDPTNPGDALLNIYRVGYAPDDNDHTPFRSYPIAQEVLNKSNQYAENRFYIQANFGLFEVFLNGTSPDHKISGDDFGNAPRARKGFNVNPVGVGNDYISYPMLGDIGFSLEPGQKAFFDQLIVRNFRAPSNIIFQDKIDEDAYTGLFADEVKQNINLGIANQKIAAAGGTEGLLVLKNPSQNATPLFRTVVKPQKKIRKARLYITSRGIYEIHSNGKRLGTDYFNPGLTQYNKHQLYQTYDLTSEFKNQTETALGIALSEGWWSGNITYSGENWNFFGDRQSFLALLVLTHEDGTEQILTSNTEDWKLYTEGPLRYGSFFQGEVYDARYHSKIAGWSTPLYDDSAWKAPVEVPLEGTTYTDKNFNFKDLKLLGKRGENVKIVKKIKPVSVQEVRPKVYVYDMGQNMVGFPKIQLPKTEPGDTLTLRYAEVLYPNLKEYAGQEGMIMLENIRAALTQDLYISNGKEAVYQPKFTFHGFRYLELSGLDAPLPLEAIEGQVLSSIDQLASSYETSNPKVNKLWENITWSLRGNFLSIPTDTPARNERMGWSGDINVFAQSATYLAAVQPFLRRHLMAMRDLQSPQGRFSDVAPVGGGFGGTLWGSAGIIIPWELYRQYGDTKTLEEHYPAMKRYEAFLSSKIEADTGYLIEGPLGDWLSPEGYKNDPTLFWSSYHLKGLEILSKTSEILGYSEDKHYYDNRYEKRKLFLNKTYFDKDSGKTLHRGHPSLRFGPPLAEDMQKKNGDWMDTQASYAIPLALEVLNPANLTTSVRNLAETIQRENKDVLGVIRPPFSLMTGFIGTASLNMALSINKRHDLAYGLLQQTSYPSWLYSVDNGATTIWERLNSYTIENGFGGNNSMNSFNHYSFGSVAAWMYRYSLGIQRDPEVAAFKKFILQPTPDPERKMKWAKGYYNSSYGKIESAWEWNTTGWDYRAVIPPNTTAVFKIEQATPKQVLLEGKRVKKNKNGVTQITQNKDELLIELVSGTYNFKILNP